SSSTPSESGDGPDGGGLSSIDEDDRYSGDRGEIRSSNQYGGEYGIGTTSGHFRDRLEFDGNMRLSSNNLGYSDSSNSTQSFYPPEKPSYFQHSHGYPIPYGYYPPFPNYGVLYQPQMHPPPPMYHPPPPFMYPPPQIYPPHQLYENQGENVTFFGYIFGQRPRESSQECSQSEGEGSDLPRHSTNCSSSTPSESGDGPDGGGLSPIDEDDRYSGDRGEIKSSSQYGGEYGIGTTSGNFRDILEFDGNMFPEPRRDRSEPRAPSKGKGKKHI
ncbi:hypothetical protein Gotur_032267, partial [Gossypium turneri]